MLRLLIISKHINIVVSHTFSVRPYYNWCGFNDLTKGLVSPVMWNIGVMDR